MTAGPTRIAMSQLTDRLRADPVTWAIAASVVLHAGAIAISMLAGDRPGAIGMAAPTALQAVLMPQQPQDSNVMASVEPAPFTVPAALPLPISPVIENAAPEALANAAGPARAFANMRIAGQLLVDRTRVGDLWSRQVSEFPIEIDRPVALTGTIEARYPPAALAQRREESVVAWVIVDAQGKAEEIEIPEGSQDFADAVRAALKETTFIPARNDLQPIRFPIALEFRFSTNAPGATAAATTR
jgi:TonB family protein